MQRRFTQSKDPVTISELKKVKFSMLTIDEKIAIKRRGRPTPDLELSEVGFYSTRTFKSTFHSGWYEKKSWLCGCEVKNALYCFPCLLYDGDYRWTQGFSNIRKLKEYADKHEISKKHIENELSLALLGVANIKGKQSEAYRISIQEHNKKVAKNRLILSKIIDFVLFCGTCEVPLYGHDETGDSGIFRGLVNFASKLNPALEFHLKTNTTFEGISKTFQNEIFDSLFKVYRSQVKKEIEEAPFIAVMVDDVTDVSESTQLVIVFRYVLNGEIFERFWGCFVPDDRTAEGISKCILQQLNIVLRDNELKLISLSLDGACFMRGNKVKIEEKINECYQNARLTHCYAHQLNLIMKNIASVTDSSKIFFSNITAISTFFSKSPQRQSALKNHINIKVEIFWDSYPRTICGVYENLEILKKCLSVLKTSNSDTTLSEAVGILNNLSDKKFLFWLEIFYLIVPHIEILYNHMQNGNTEDSTSKVLEYVENFESCISAIKNSKYCENTSSLLTADAKLFFEYLSEDMVERYSFTGHLLTANLLNKKKFIMFKKLFPSEEIKLIVKVYSGINKSKLENELRVFYNSSEIHEYSKMSDLLSFITENNLNYIFGELINLINMLLTIPMTTKEPGRYFSSLKKIRTFLQSAKSEDRLNALTMIFTEQNFFDRHSQLKDTAIDLFSVNKQRRRDFSFKSGDSFFDEETPLKKFKREENTPNPEKTKWPAKRAYNKNRVRKSEIQSSSSQKPMPSKLSVASTFGTAPRASITPDVSDEHSEFDSSYQNSFSHGNMEIRIKKEPVDFSDTEGESNDMLGNSDGESLFQPMGLIEEHPITIEEEPMLTEEQF
ncbi:zinc finger MYM-type protein 1 [Parasteatoda tepidariorum]|uniref:zinc finger MYM-type protein 1 n=1 Tax=Parasteatoda tepidariorum TaxID=114398 RepID=UPI001C721338|nr:uncharacterized protein LOC107450629 [Parasteatoda tepidariorum]